MPAETTLAQIATPIGEQAMETLATHLHRLQQLPAHGNRELKYDQLFIGLLISFYNPTVRSLRLIDACGNFKGQLDVDRMARSTTSDALKVFDPEHLRPIIEELARSVDSRGDQTLKGITQRIIAGDGSYFTTFCDVAWILHQARSDGRLQGQVRLNLQLDVQRWTPQVVSVSGDDGSEPAAFARDLLSDVLYMLDRNFLDFDFLGQLLQRGNNFVLRVRSNAPATQVVRDLPLTAAGRRGGVVRDQIVTLSGTGAPAGEFRLVVVQTTNRTGKIEIIRLLSSLTDPEIDAATIGEIYRQRWQIELFFKWLKTWANFDHLLSTSRNGITFQFYVAVIAVLLMYQRLGRRVSRYAIVCLHLLLNEQITFDHMMRTLDKLEREKELNRQSAARRRAAKKRA